MKKRLFSILTAFIILAMITPQALCVVDKSEEFYVADYANVLSPSLENEIIAANGDLEHYCKGAQIVVVTVEYLDGMYSDEYAMQLFNNWGVGSGTENNGMLLLLATEENKAWLTVGTGISGSFTDKMADEYFEEYFWEDFDKGDYEEAVEEMLEELFEWYGTYYGVYESGQITTAPPEKVPDRDGDYRNEYDGGHSIFDRIFGFFSSTFFIRPLAKIKKCDKIRA